jgi:hypothetical protein
MRSETVVPNWQVSIRLQPETFEQLDMQSRRAGQSRALFAKTLLDEGLRMQAHPGIVFRDGPAGRRPGLAGGPDIWEIVRVWQSLDARSDEAVTQLAELTSLPVEHARSAVRYYSEYADEIDAWIQRVDEEAARAEAAWHAEQVPPQP